MPPQDQIFLIIVICFLLIVLLLQDLDRAPVSRIDPEPTWQPPKQQPVLPQPHQIPKKRQNDLVGEFAKALMEAMMKDMVEDMFGSQNTTTESQQSPAPTGNPRSSYMKDHPLPPSPAYSPYSHYLSPSPPDPPSAPERPERPARPARPDVSGSQQNGYDQYNQHRFGAIQQPSDTVADGWHNIGRTSYDWNDSGQETAGWDDKVQAEEVPFEGEQ